jgi:hypothetical protein
MRVTFKESVFLAALALLAPATAVAEIVTCTERDGSLYIGISPPANCVPLDKARRVPGRDGGSSSKGELHPTPRPKGGAVVLRNMSKQLRGNERFAEGSVANEADLPAYNVQACVDGLCHYTSPSTLQPGETATFSIPANSSPLEESKGVRITWDAVREGTE